MELLLTFKPLHVTASKQTISRWIRLALNAAGVDTTRFKPHSTRHTSTSLVHSRSVSMILYVRLPVELRIP
ncbi:hypothetical protein NQ314_010393 [Rhamnusium bicolor]|uniref:Tyr recombinase domain-containing protein n=1 Tax=Rhamnusium bicolor TaxID=1586634 RepID=A0AAV8XTA8_9CUCU|nr:hypothetical protein NQ314_010393 [Rhamnusium bicolor]